MRRFLTPPRLAALGLVLLALAIGVLLLAPAGDTYIFLPNEAHPVDPLVKVDGHTPTNDGGAIYFVDVIVRRATLMERLVPQLRTGASLVPAHAINPTGLSDAARRRTSLREMTLSQKIAAAVALRELGYEVEAEPDGALVDQVFRASPAATALQPTDVIVEALGEPVRTPGDLRRIFDDVRPGDEVDLVVVRGDERREVALTTIASDQEPKRAVIGVLVRQDARIELPLDVKIDAGDVGGPSAGLAFTLQLLQELGCDVDRGRRIAATGEISLDGDVEPVGGLKQKTIGAREAGIDLFLVPAGDNAAEARRHADGLRIVPVRSFQQALRSLATNCRRPQETSG